MLVSSVFSSPSSLSLADPSGTTKASSTLHVGFDKTTNLVNKFLKYRNLWRNWFNEEFHTFGMEWSEHGIWTWEGTPNRRIMDAKFKKPFSDFVKPQYDQHGVLIPGANPWTISNNTNAPFDQRFYLIVNLAVGGTGGYFLHNDPIWSNAEQNAAGTFWKLRDQTWLPTWSEDKKERSLKLDYIKMWQRC